MAVRSADPISTSSATGNEFDGPSHPIGIGGLLSRGIEVYRLKWRDLAYAKMRILTTTR